jgi:fatty acid desaturase
MRHFSEEAAVNETSRNQGWAITGGAIFLGLLFLAGILQGSYWALAIPVAVLVFFVLGLVAWVGHTIATVQVEPETPIEPEPSSESRATQAS